MVSSAGPTRHLDNLRRMELENAKKPSAQCSMNPGNADDPSRFKVRRDKVGGWTDYVSEEQAAALNMSVREKLVHVYGYVD
jgi:hypothetical protein